MRKHFADMGLMLLAAVVAGCGGDATEIATLKKLEVTPAVALVAAGEGQSYTAVAYFTDGSSRVVTAQVRWSSSMPSVVVGPDGIATSTRTESSPVIIGATLDSVVAGASLTVTGPVVRKVSIVPANMAISSGSTNPYAAYATLSDGSGRDVTAEVYWSSSDSNVAAVSNTSGSNGTVSGQAQGEAEIRALYEGVLPAVTGSTLVTVVPSLIYGGGDMLAALAYVGDSWFVRDNPESSRRLSNPANPQDQGSLFGSFTAQSEQSQCTGPQPPDSSCLNPRISYCQAGDQIGKSVLAGEAYADSECGDFTGTPVGFSSTLRDPHFAAAELPLMDEEFSAIYRIQSIAHTAPVQVPALAASIAIAYRLDGVSDTLDLDSSDLCAIFSGAVTNWSELSAKLNLTLPDKAITVVYRDDRAAATYSLANHLSYRGHPPAGQMADSSCAGFRAEPFFINVVTGTFPPRHLSAGSNPAMGALIADTDGAIGYGEAADLRLRYPDLKFAKVNGKHPFDDLQSPVISVYAKDCVITGSNPKQTATSGAACGQSGAVTPRNIEYGRPTINPATANADVCTVLVNADSYADPSTATAPATVGYPIVNISYLLAYKTGNGNSTEAIRRLLLAPYATAAGTEERPTLPPGFVYLSGYAPADTITNCIRP